MLGYMSGVRFAVTCLGSGSGFGIDKRTETRIPRLTPRDETSDPEGRKLIPGDENNLLQRNLAPTF